MMANFRRFFLRGLAIILPTVLTIWILIAAYQFVQERIASPINTQIRRLLIVATPYPRVDEAAVLAAAVEDGKTLTKLGLEPEVYEKYERDLRRASLDKFWGTHKVWLDLIGLGVAIILIYIAGVLLGSFLGRRLLHRGEQLLQRVPLFKQVYPHVKQVTDFLFAGDERERVKFRRVVAVEYPRKGVWSVALVTGEVIKQIQHRSDEPYLTVFVPSSPTPFTGYVVTVPERDTIDLPITIDQALRFTISGGVIPPSQPMGGSRDGDETDTATRASA